MLVEQVLIERTHRSAEYIGAAEIVPAVKLVRGFEFNLQKPSAQIDLE